ncbi:MAG TPA: 4'-phosphopantetheinyl transferase superfamily protein [Pseudolabrys sp.]|nr:4'-phosphopantetheinyl transferase superfamily protein [Pseudolabrys sp.]
MFAIVDVYAMDLDRADLDEDRIAEFLCEEESRRAARFRAELDRRRYIARRAGLRILLSRYLSVPARKLSFRTNGFGKPFLRESDLRFSVSHSAGTALVAIARERELGCDIEFRDPAFPSEKIAQAFFSASEVCALRRVDPSFQIEAFFNCWTRKEAYIKARGFGLSLPLDSFEVSLVPAEPAALLRGCDGWSVESFEPRAGFQAAVVAEGDDWKLNIRPAELEWIAAV